MTVALDTKEASAWRTRARQFLAPEFVTPAILLAPSILLLLVVIAYPMLQGFYFSFTDGSLMKGGDFVGIANYTKLLGQPAFWHSLRFSAVFAACNIAGCYLLGLGLALLLQMDMPGRGAFRVLLLLPWIVPSLVSIVSWRWMVNDERALFNQIITLFGGDPIFFLSDSNWAVTIVILIKIWRSFPFMMLSLLAALQSIDRSLKRLRVDCVEERPRRARVARRHHQVQGSGESGERPAGPPHAPAAAATNQRAARVSAIGRVTSMCFFGSTVAAGPPEGGHYDSTIRIAAARCGSA